jgi:hypothetical protein
VFHSWLSSEQDGVLLEICNRNEESCVWSLFVTTSLNLVHPLWFHKRLQTRWVCLLLQPCALLESSLPSILVLVISQVILNTAFILFAEQWCQCWIHIEACFYLQVLTNSRHVPNPEFKKVIAPTFVPLRQKKCSMTVLCFPKDLSSFIIPGWDFFKGGGGGGFNPLG